MPSRSNPAPLRRAGATAGTLLVLAAGACTSEAPARTVDVAPPTSTSTSPPEEVPASTPVPSPQAGATVLVVSVDGLAARALEEPERHPLPGLERLFREGAGTLNARTAVEQTVTMPNHSAILTGRQILGPDGTSVTFNDDPGTTLAQAHGAYVPGVFDVAHDHGLRTAFVSGKRKFGFFARSWGRAHGAADTTGADDGTGKLDVVTIGGSDPSAATIRALSGDGPARLTFLHLAGPDLVGHASGFLSAPYWAALERADAVLIDVLAHIDAHPRLRDTTSIILTADHGGAGREHGSADLEANYRIPFVVWGGGVAEGDDLYALNPLRRDPAATQPSYDGPQPVRNRDAAALALSILGLPPLAGTTSALALR